MTGRRQVSGQRGTGLLRQYRRIPEDGQRQDSYQSQADNNASNSLCGCHTSPFSLCTDSLGNNEQNRSEDEYDA